MATSSQGNTMPVREVIEALLKVPDQNAPVILDGCDCFGPCVEVVIHDGEVLLARG